MPNRLSTLHHAGQSIWLDFTTAMTTKNAANESDPTAQTIIGEKGMFHHHCAAVLRSQPVTVVPVI